MKDIGALIDNGGDITVSRSVGINWATMAADGRNSVGTLVRRDGETLYPLLDRRISKRGLKAAVTQAA